MMLDMTGVESEGVESPSPARTPMKDTAAAPRSIAESEITNACKAFVTCVIQHHPWTSDCGSRSTRRATRGTHD